jgi:serine/threonine protein kinase
MTRDLSNPPTLVAGRYELQNKLGEGGSGEVFKALDRTTGQFVALKVMPPEQAGNPLLRKRFEQEFRAASTLQHPNLVRGLDYFELGLRAYLVMEFVEGESVGDRLERSGPLLEAEAVQIIVQVCAALEEAHQRGLIHRDVKPDNILLGQDGAVKLSDLGLVKDAQVELTRTGRGLGTPHFMAPEQFRDAKHADERCDIYSLGATLYMMVTGVLPFNCISPFDAWSKKVKGELNPPRKLKPSLSVRVNQAILKAMDPKPERRQASCREFCDDLVGKGAASGEPSLADKGFDFWYAVYHDQDGAANTYAGSSQNLRRLLAQGRLGDPRRIEASRNRNGPFQPLAAYPELADLVAEAAPPAPPAPPVAAPAPATGPAAPPAPSRSGSGVFEWVKAGLWLIFIAATTGIVLKALSLLP